jgi:hypothetical protein
MAWPESGERSGLASCFWGMRELPVRFHSLGVLRRDAPPAPPACAPQPSAFPHLETKPSGLCTQVALRFFFFFPFRVSIGRIHHWEERKGEGYRSLKPKSHILFPEPRRIGGGVPNSLLLGRRLQHTALGSRSAQEVRLLPWRGESSAAGHDWFPGSWGVGGRRSHCSFGPGEKYWRGGGWFIL